METTSPAPRPRRPGARWAALLIVLSVLSPLAGTSLGQGWPTYQHDAQRSGIASGSLAIPLHEQWRFEAMHAPKPAWPPPAVRDIWNQVTSHPRVTFDRAMQLVAGDGRIYFGSSVDGRVVCLDAASGEILWEHFTSAPIRLAPALANGNLYFGGDDGLVHCLDAANGERVWAFRAAPTDRLIPGNDRIISSHPVRTGVLVEGDRAYFGAGLLPTEGVFLYAVNAINGELIWKQQADISPQGFLLSSRDHLYAPTGRTAPAVFDKQTGKLLHQLEGSGTTFALVSDDTLTYGYGRGSEGLQSVRGGERVSLAWIEGTHLIIRGHMAYSFHNNKLRAIDRARLIELTAVRTQLNADRQRLAGEIKQAGDSPQAEALRQQWSQLGIELESNGQAMRDCLMWQVDCPHPYALILAGDVLVAGGDEAVAAYDLGSGAEVWSAPVRGKAYGLAVSDGRLLVSTDQGVVHAFAGQSVAAPATVVETPRALEEDPGAAAKLTHAAAAAIIERSGIATRPGYCLVLGDDDGLLTERFAQAGRMFIVVHQPDERAADALRRRMHQAGLLGARVSVHTGALEALPYTDYFANQIILAPGSAAVEALRALAADGYRVLRPSGGQVRLITANPTDRALVGRASRPPSQATPQTSAGGTPAPLPDSPLPADITAEWSRFEAGGRTFHEWVATRGPLPGAGEWTHPFANPANTTSSNDQLVAGPMLLQWFGGPGPEPMLDRHHRNIPPVYKDGRLFIPGDERVIAIDAYNGVTLWDVATPGSRTVAAPLDASGMVVGEDLLYIAVGSQCWALDVETGERRAVFDAPRDHDGNVLDWGYLAVVNDQLIGSAQLPSARWRDLGKDPVNVQFSDAAPVVTSQTVFSLDRKTGKPQWQFDGGSILNPSLAIEGGKVYLAQAPTPAAAGRSPIKDLKGEGLNLVALDLRSGQVRWRTCPDEIQVAEHNLTLTVAGGKLAAVMSYNKDNRLWYRVAAFEAATGEASWQVDQDNGATGGSHGEQVLHPTILGDVLIAEPRAYDLSEGKPIDPAVALGLTAPASGQSDAAPWVLRRGGHGCGTLSASSRAIFYRAGNPTMYEFGTGPRKLTTVSRPGCWINMIPAGGLVLIPEASSGCSCSFSLQTSFAFIPTKQAK